MQANIREICFRINEIFQLLLSHKQAKEREEELEQEAAVKPRMLRRLSTSHQQDNSPTRLEEGAEEEPDDVTMTRNADLRRQIDEQFSMLTAEPHPSQQTTTPHIKPIVQPRIHRVAREPTGKGPIRKTLSCTTEESDDDDDEATPIVVPPLQVQKLAAHNGMVHHQKLEDTAGVVVGDRSELLVPKGKPRPSIENFWDPSPPPLPPAAVSSRQERDYTPTRSPLGSFSTPPPSAPSPSPSELLALRVRSLLLTNFEMK